MKISKTGSRRPQTNRLSKIFHNWSYAGWVVSEPASILPKTIRGQWEALVTTEEFEHGLTILDRRNRKPNNHYKHTYLLKGIIYLRHPVKGTLARLTCSTSNTRRKNGGNAYYCVKSSNINLQCQMVDAQVEEIVKGVQVDPDLVPMLREHYTQEVAEKLGYMKPDEQARIKNALQEIDQEEERTLRLYAAGRVTEEIWNNLWREWQDRRQKLVDRREIAGSPAHFSRQQSGRGPAHYFANRCSI